MKVGFAEVVITPQEPVLLAGYDLPWSTGVHDDLYASAVYLEEGETRALLVSFDLLAMERDLIARLKDAIMSACPIPRDHIFFTCTHTHEGPEVRERKFRDHWGPHPRPDYLDRYQRDLMAWTAAAAQQAAAQAQECDLIVNRAYVDENVNRRFFLTDERYLSIPGNKHLVNVAREHADKELGILAFCPPGSRRPLGLILNYTMHPLTAGNTSTLISADVPGVVRAVIWEGMQCPACYITGAAGDNHGAGPDQRWHSGMERGWHLVVGFVQPAAPHPQRHVPADGRLFRCLAGARGRSGPVRFKGTSGGPAEAALTTGVYIYRTAFSHGDMRMGYAATMSLFLGLVNMLITGIVFKTLRTERN